MGSPAVIEVSCPGCAAKFKAPDTMLGRKAKCTKCGKTFRVPAAPPAGGSPAPGAPPAPAALVPEAENAEVMMAEAVDPVEAAPPPVNLPAAVPVPNVAALPSADPFDFSQPAPAKAAQPTRSKDKSPPVPAPTPKPVAPPVPAPAKVAAPPAVSPEAPAPAAKPKPAPEPLSLGDEPPIGGSPAKPAAAAKSAPAEEGAGEDLFAFSSPPTRGEKGEKATKAKRRHAEDKPASAKSGDDAPPKKDKAEEKREQPAPAKSKPAPRDTGADSYNPFADFDASDEPASAPPEPGKRARSYQRASKSGGLFKAVLVTGAIGVCAIGLGAAATSAYVKNLRREAEQAQKDAEELAKKNEKKEEEPSYVAPPAGQPGRDRPPEPKAGAEPGPNEPEPKAPVSGAGAGRPVLTLPAKLRSFTVGPLPPKFELVDKPRARIELDVALPTVKRVFPPFDPTTADTCVLLQTRSGADGKGEKLALDSYGPGGKRVADARIEYDGDGSAAPIADLFASAKGVFFLHATAGKLTVWNVVEKKKVAEAVEPYADKPDHARAGLAAAYFAADPSQVVTVSTAGAVLLYDLPSRKAVAEFVPPNGVPGKVALGQSIAVADGHGCVALAVAGVLYQVRSAPELQVLRKYDLEGDVSRSLGLAVSGTPGRVLYAFEVDKAGKKEKVVLGVSVDEAAKHVIYRWPDGLGDPKGAFWANGTGAGVATDRGALWFDDDEGKFLPLVLTQPAAAGLYFGDDRYFWCLLPHPKVPAKSELVALPLPFNDATEYRKAFPANQPLRATRISTNGLEK